MLSMYLSVIDDAEDRLLFERIYNSYRKSMFYVARDILGDRMDAEDVVHDVFSKIASKHMDRIRHIDDEDDLKNYLLKATKNTAINLAKRKERVTVSSDMVNTLIEIEQEEIPDKDFVEMLCTKAEYEQVVIAITQLGGIYSDVLYYHFVLEMPTIEVAELLQLKTDTVKKQLTRGKKLLLKSLNV